MKTTKTYNLERFVEAQNAGYATALMEITNGSKNSHWMECERRAYCTNHEEEDS